MTAGVFEGTAIASVILRCADLERSLQWYREKLGWAHLSRGVVGHEEFATYSAGGLLISLWQLPPGEAPARAGIRGAYVTIYVHDDVPTLRDRLVQRGVEAHDLIDVDTFTSFRFADPDGNVFEVTTAKAGAVPPVLG